MSWKIYPVFIIVFLLISGCTEMMVGSIEVSSTPAGADVYLDGNSLGKAPLTIPEVTAGNHAIELRYTGYASWTRVVEVIPGETLHVDGILVPVMPTPVPTTGQPTPTISPTPTGNITPVPAQTTQETGIPTTIPTVTATPNATGGPLVLRAYNLEFDQAILQATADTFITIKFENFDTGIAHNFAVFPYTSRSQTIFRGSPIIGPDSAEYTFRAPNPGIYYFQDDDHARFMNGILVINPAMRTNYCPVGFVPIQLKVRNTPTFDITSIRVPWQQNGDSTTVILLTNLDDGRPHNFALYSDIEGKLLVYRGNSITGIDKTVYSFATPRPGTYYYRDDLTPGFVMGEYVSYDVPTCG